MSLRRALLLAVLVAYCVALAAVLLGPSSAQQSQWVREVRWTVIGFGFESTTVTQDRAEFICNALILMPVSALGSLAWPRTTWRDWTAVAFALSALVELAQGLLLPERTASYADVVANTLGGLGGALVVLVVRRLLPAREGRQELDR